MEAGLKWTPKVERIWHDQMIEMLIAEPTLTNEQLSLGLDLHVQTVALVRRSDMFQLKYKQRLARLEEATNEHVRNRVEGRIARVADSALENLEIQLEQQRNLLLSGQIVKEMRDTRETAETVLSALGYSRKGAAPAQAPQQNNAVFVVDAALLKSAQEKMRALGNVTDVEPLPSLPAPETLSER